MEPTPEQSPHHAYPDHWEADVVLRDGGTARIRPITTDDAERLVSFYEQVSDESKYYRFFAPYPRLSDRDVHRFTHHDYVDRVGLAVTIGGEFIGTVRYDRINEQGRPASAPADEAEVAFLVQDAHQGRGVASALLEHIAAVARERGIRRFAAEVLPANTKMIKVFRDAGYTQQRSFEDGSVHLTLDLEPTEKSLAVQRGREQRAEARSVQRLLAPGSVAVIGTGRTPGGVGRTVLRNLLAAGFTGRTYAVNRAFDEGLTTLDGVPAHRSLGEIDERVDLAVIAVPAHRVPEAVADCGEHGVQGLVVLSAGYAERGSAGRELQRELVRQARSYGMRIIGPNAFGIINTAESVRLNASLAPESPARGRIGLFTQSGAIGIALLSGLHRRGAGLSSFISAGNRADVSGNDFLQYSFEDPDTDVALLYLESLGNPRKFTRLARRTAAVKPVVVVKGARHSGTNPPGHAVPVSRIPDATVSALMRQAGVIRVDTVTEMVDAGLLLADQPLPAGPRVAILGNSESLGLLTYDACLAEGLRPRPPVDLTTAASPQDFRDALAEALADGTCDAVIVTAIPWVGENGNAETGDGEVLAAALRGAAAGGPAKPVAVVHVEIGGLAEALAAASSTAAPRTRPTTLAGRPAATPGTTAPGASATTVTPPTSLTTDTTATTGTAPTTDTTPPTAATPTPDTPPTTTPTTPGRIPAYPAAERAVRAMAEAVKYAQWRRQAATPGKVPEFLDDTIDEPGTAALIDTLLGPAPDPRGRPLAHDEVRELLGRYGIPVRPTLPAPDAEAAVAAAARLGYPVALKTTAPHLRHRADLGGVRLDLPDEEALRRAYGELTDLLGKPAELLPVVQAMAPRGVDTVVRASIDAAAGAILSFGLAGAPSELLGDTAHRLVPATDRDAAELIRSIKAAPVLFGWRGSAPVDTAALEELLLRLSRLVDDHPEVVSVALEPVVVAPQGITVLGASVRLAPPPPRGDLGPRRLPNY
ncbi:MULTISPECIES: bifunctional GNAT family N-acetyltransferase/acetate--CoA ligase family protein [Streptomyces]|uniref:bifunctional acetate--CoA ligase family protein/GNAT family N-acetyltransferase n=1 Tax=Streptomyces TaxID=1883 RepID=UPI00103DDF6C|nr:MULTISPECIES: bifunctional GNAT family N-acetyltransferase/acetate--CoA ligase family protein [Streptomyces]MBT3072441.1 GNAT family N-acetyltransferase [Streptomyces sp. COG21]MBT3080841.1 GNAT family N-acetyltransferase [Streptomyces sp. COG20]MBT3086801.1 GNAT family N-acetyltransferase [Streptomyces sp. CYG21]MBT3099849.1 GNAT family N-acetyltransferase [Streptomyces sp. CBG30]MBT3102430.1 GNAT family N-acetyltransferase [Streptomyces sp. COG19]